MKKHGKSGEEWRVTSPRSFKKERKEYFGVGYYWEQAQKKTKINYEPTRLLQ